MSTGSWKPKENPPDNQPTSLLLLISQKFEELAAIDSKRAQVSGEISGLFRTARQQEKSDLPATNRKIA